jgi:hypothetical protein
MGEGSSTTSKQGRSNYLATGDGRGWRQLQAAARLIREGAVRFQEAALVLDKGLPLRASMTTISLPSDSRSSIDSRRSSAILPPRLTPVLYSTEKLKLDC